MEKNHTDPAKYTVNAEHTEMVQLIEEAAKLKDSQPATAMQKAKQAGQIAHKTKDYYYLAKSQDIVGISQIFLGNFKDAIQILEENLKFVRQHLPDNIEHLSLAYNGLGLAYLNGGKYQAALNTLLIALSFSYPPLLPSIYDNLGMIYGYIGDYNRALEFGEAGLEKIDKKEEVAIYAQIAYNMAFVLFELGRTQEAKQGFKKVLDLFEQNKERVSRKVHIRSLNMLGEVYRREKNYSASLDTLAYALQLAQSENFTSICCDIETDKAKVYFEQADGASGIACLLSALAYINKGNLHKQKQGTLEQITSYYKKIGKFQEAFHYLEQLHQILEKQYLELRNKNFKKIVTEREKEIQLLEEKNKEIEEHNTILEQFAYVISHDLREPLRGITGFSNLLEKKYGQLLDENGKEYIHFILSETSSINNNLARLLEYTTFKKPKADEIQRIHLAKIISQEQERHTGLPCKLNINCGDIHLKMAPLHARTLFHELIKNAIQFRKKEEDCSVEIYSEFIDGLECIAVKDYGIGIEEQYQKKVFRIFNQLNKLNSKGTGVGLAICQRIINLYNGKIWIESEENDFTILHFTLPAFIT